MTEAPRHQRASGLPRLIYALSFRLAAVEKVAAALLIAAVALLILLNVFTRYVGYALYWVDELAIYAMVWSALVAGSLSVHLRSLVSVTLVLDMLRGTPRRVINRVNDLLMFGFGVFFIWLCWIWFSPIQFYQAGFDPGEFAMSTGQFIYGEPTNTLGIKKVWLWLIMPVFAVTFTVHALANVLETLGARK
ncbi:TRAP transporter small permease [Alkalilimnicola sp. S0819]|uniref:TRAP transporter small permease n=1 Tax=Alkalilimnicola sp. S0819 TaxID=2613922 RepID=UPI001261EB37|nr:TRAP transporter small permease [Alkalilimnicola sp. S0819]KAB7623996.1 TRAP transporter small permease [Alkalilimnicola sp. S0819]MPQ16601.1 TRAP transporter small permease subunit [Alkalilimnicola sp. S0819]